MRHAKWWRLPAAALALTLFAAACGNDDSETSSPGGDTSVTVELAGDTSKLAEIRERGNLICGVNATLSGFGVVDDDGEYSGFDIDFCHAMAVTVIGDADAVEFIELTPEQRFQALQTGQIDILIRNTTWTATRDGAEGVRFGPTTFYDGQGFMVPEESGFTTPEDLEGARICVQRGTTTQLNMTSYLDSQGVDFEPAVFEDNTELVPAYQAGQCEALTSDKSQLASIKASIEEDDPDATQFIFAETISKEPLGPGVLDGDAEFAQIMDWVVFAIIQAEEFGISSENIDARIAEVQAAIDAEEQFDANEARFLGLEDGFDAGLGLEADFAVQIINAVGNYAEIYERHIPAIGLTERGVNSLWTGGGLLYSPPYR